MQHYIRYRVPLKHIYDKLNTNQYKRINFFIDLLSISRGFYNKNTIQMELSNYFETKRMPTIFIQEVRDFLNDLYKRFKQYQPRFILFFDDGQAKQNKSISNTYKTGRQSSLDAFLDSEQKEVFRAIRHYYFAEIDKNLNRKGISTILYIKEYETDLIPGYCLDNGYLDSLDQSTINIIISVDKDLLQCCKHTNTFQAVSVYKRSESKIDMVLYDNDTAITHIYKNFKRGLVKAQHIPLILAVGGDKADNIDGVKGIGVAGIIKMITQYDLPPLIYQNTPLPDKLEPHRKIIINNLKLTDFTLQAERLPLQIKKQIEIKLKEM